MTTASWAKPRCGSHPLAHRVARADQPHTGDVHMQVHREGKQLPVVSASVQSGVQVSDQAYPAPGGSGAVDGPSSVAPPRRPPSTPSLDTVRVSRR